MHRLIQTFFSQLGRLVFVTQSVVVTGVVSISDRLAVNNKPLSPRQPANASNSLGPCRTLPRLALELAAWILSHDRMSQLRDCDIFNYSWFTADTANRNSSEGDINSDHEVLQVR
jgi:hypothetical protein